MLTMFNPRSWRIDAAMLYWALLLIATGVLSVVLMLIAPEAASAATEEGGEVGTVPLDLQLWAFVAGFLAPAVAYVVNKYMPWISEPVKGVVFVAVAAAAGALTQLIDTGSVGFNDETLQLVLSSVVAAVIAHVRFYTRSGLNVALGAQQNAGLSRRRR